MSNLNIYYQNVRVLRNKLVNFRCSLPLFLSYDILVLIKTWLIPDITDSELGQFGFQMFRLDRYIENNPTLEAKEYLLPSNPNSTPSLSFYALNVYNLEQLFITISFDSANILIGSTYLPSLSPLPIVKFIIRIKKIKYCDFIEFESSSIIEENKNKHFVRFSGIFFVLACTCKNNIAKINNKKTQQ